MFSFFKNIFTPKSLDTTTDRLFADWDLISYEELLEHFDVENQAVERGKQNAPAKVSEAYCH